MSEPKPNILFDSANLYLNPDDMVAFGSTWRDDFREERFVPESGSLDMIVEEDYFLEIRGIKIPTYGMEDLSCKEGVVNSARRLIGDLDPALERYVNLLEKDVVQDDLYFTPNGLCDYSKSNSFDLQGKSVGEWVSSARNLSECPRIYLPNEIKLPENSSIEFVPTFQALREIHDLNGKNSSDRFFIKGSTFSESIQNFLKMYDTIVAHVNWKEETERMVRHNDSYKSKVSPSQGYAYVGELVVK